MLETVKSFFFHFDLGKNYLAEVTLQNPISLD